MLILPDSSSLGDKHLSPEEANFKIREKNQTLVDQKKLSNQSLLENKDMAIGQAMQPSEFLRRLQTLNPGIVVKPGISNAVALYYPMWSDDEQKTVLKYVSGFYVNEMMQEFSNITVDEKGLPRREVRGWRSVLLSFIKQGILSYSQVKGVFGEPKGQRNTLWNAQTQQQRA